MKYPVNRRLLVPWLLFLSLSLSGCSSLIAKYDQIAYQQATSLKVDALVLMDKATDSYSTHEGTAKELMIKVDKAYEYAKGRLNNKIITKHWSIMKDPTRRLLGGFLARWKDKGRFSETFVREAKRNVSMGFDQIIGLESGLIKQ